MTFTACLDPALGSEDESALVRRCQNGDERAWRALYESQFDFVYRLARRLGTPIGEAEDVAQEVFLIAHRRLGDFTHGKVSTWLYRICANIVLNRRKHWRVRAAFAALKVWLGAAPPETPERHVQRASAHDRVELVIARMKPKKREAFVLFELCGLSIDEIAERVGCVPATVSTRLFHARRDFLRIAGQLGCLDEDGGRP